MELVNAAVMYFYAVFISENLVMPIKFPDGKYTVYVYLFISSLFNDAVITSDCIVPSDKLM
jgi:hypothetical protein